MSMKNVNASSNDDMVILLSIITISLIGSFSYFLFMGGNHSEISNIYMSYVFLALFIASVVSFSWSIHLPNNVNYVLISCILMLACFTILQSVVGYPNNTGFNHPHECVDLSRAYPHVFVHDCVQYINANPDATGAEIVDAFNAKTVNELEVMLTHSLKP